MSELTINDVHPLQRAERDLPGTYPRLVIVLPDHGLIFVKTWKTAGTSIEVFLERVGGDNAIVTPIRPEVNGHRPRNHEGTPFRNHLPASAIRSALGTGAWADFTSFCVERNPWDQVISTYFFRRAIDRSDLSWDDFVASRDFLCNHVQYTEETDRSRVIVDHVLKYESLHDELGELLSAHRIPFAGLTVRAKGNYRTDRRPYRESYTARQAAIVADEMATEIRLNGYEY